MIIKNIAIGNDKYGHMLFCGDICKYKIKDAGYKGMIFYESSEYSFAFEQTDDSFPIVMMDVVDSGTIEKLVSVQHMNSEFPEYDEWIGIYNSNLGIL